MNTIKVVHVKNYGKQNKTLPDGHYVYCGRPSPYGNPYFMANEAMRQKVIADFAEKTLPNLDISHLIELSKLGNLYLGCFCAPKACHCDKIKERIISEIFLLHTPKTTMDEAPCSRIVF